MALILKLDYEKFVLADAADPSAVFRAFAGAKKLYEHYNPKAFTYERELEVGIELVPDAVVMPTEVYEELKKAEERDNITDSVEKEKE